MSVNTIGAYASQSAAAAASSAATASSGSAMQLNQSDFLKLLVTQMKDEDPSKPTDPSVFINEMSDLSEVSDMNSMSNSVSSLTGSLASSQLLNGTNLVGHTVLAAGSSAALTSGGSITGAVTVPSGTTALNVQVTNAGGALVRTFSVAPRTGTTAFTWDGTTNSGTAAPAGNYTFSVTADTNGSQGSLTPQLAYQVNSVTLNPSSNSLTLNTNAGALPLSSVTQIF